MGGIGPQGPAGTHFLRQDTLIHGNTLYLTPATATNLYIKAWGGGGGGATVITVPGVGGGGGGGGYSEGWVTLVSSGGTCLVPSLCC